MNETRYDVALCGTLYPPAIGGPATYLPRFAEHAAKKLKLFLLVPKGSTPIPGIEHVYYRRSYVIKYLDTFLCEFILALKLRWAARRVRVMYCHGCEFALGILFSLGLGQGLGCRWTMKFTGYNPWERTAGENPLSIDAFAALSPWKVFKSNGFRTALLHTFFRVAVRRMDLIIVPGTNLKSVLENLGVRSDRIQTILNPMKFLGGPSTTDAPLQTSDLKLVTVARLVRHKGIHELIQWTGKRPTVRLEIIGTGDDEAYLKSLAAGFSNVIFLGSLPRAEVHRRLGEATLFVLNSTYEGFSHVLVEAISLGRPYVATRIPGNEEVNDLFGGTAGTLYTPHDESSFWDAVKHVCATSPDWAGVRKTIEGDLSEDVLFSRTETILLNG